MNHPRERLIKKKKNIGILTKPQSSILYEEVMYHEVVPISELQELEKKEIYSIDKYTKMLDNIGSAMFGIMNDQYLIKKYNEIIRHVHYKNEDSRTKINIINDFINKQQYEKKNDDEDIEKNIDEYFFYFENDFKTINEDTETPPSSQPR